MTNYTGTVWCIHCRDTVPAEAEQCPHCGKPLNDKSKVIQCPSCGKYILKGDTVCRHCHTSFSAPDAPEESTEPKEEPSVQDTPPSPVTSPAGPSARAAQEPAHSESPKAVQPVAPRKAAAESKRKKRGELPVILIFIVLTLCIGVGAFFLGQKLANDRTEEQLAIAENLIKTRYEEGYADGYASGNYGHGFDEGALNGYTEGHLAGYTAGYEDGEALGYAAGYRDASQGKPKSR